MIIAEDLVNYASVLGMISWENAFQVLETCYLWSLREVQEYTLGISRWHSQEESFPLGS